MNDWSNWLQVTSFKLQVTSYKLQVTSYKLQVKPKKNSLNYKDDSGWQLWVLLDVSLQDDPTEAVASHEDLVRSQTCGAGITEIILI
jgi:hypothetical protein